MNKTNMKSVIILKNLPSNLIDEAIVVIKDKKRVKADDYNEVVDSGGEKIRNNNKLKNQTLQGQINAEELSKIEKINKEERKYVIKEAEFIVNNYVDNLEKKSPDKKIKKLQAKCRKIRVLNIMLFIATFISTIIAITK